MLVATFLRPLGVIIHITVLRILTRQPSLAGTRPGAPVSPDRTPRSLEMATAKSACRRVWAPGDLLMTLSMTVFWVLLIAGIIALIRYSARPPARTEIPPARAPEQLLAERFARGGIDEDDYHQRLAALREGGASSRT